MTITLDMTAGQAAQPTWIQFLGVLPLLLMIGGLTLTAVATIQIIRIIRRGFRAPTTGGSPGCTQPAGPGCGCRGCSVSPRPTGAGRRSSMRAEAGSRPECPAGLDPSAHSTA